MSGGIAAYVLTKISEKKLKMSCEIRIARWSHGRPSQEIRFGCEPKQPRLESRKLVQVTIDGAKPPLPFTMVHLLKLSNWNGEVADPL